MILSNKGNVEHAAFHLEQSYEKILEAVHGTYRLHIRNVDFKQVYKDGGTVDFMLSVLSDLHSVYVEYIHILPKRLEEKRRNEEISKSEEFLVNSLIKRLNSEKQEQKLQETMKSIKNKINELRSNDEKFAEFLMQPSADNILPRSSQQRFHGVFFDCFPLLVNILVMKS